MNIKNVQIKIIDNYYNGKVYYEDHFKWKGIIYNPTKELLGYIINNNTIETNIGIINFIGSLSLESNLNEIDIPNEIEFVGANELKIL